MVTFKKNVKFLSFKKGFSLIVPKLFTCIYVERHEPHELDWARQVTLYFQLDSAREPGRADELELSSTRAVL